jgi:hypothetical protein
LFLVFLLLLFVYFWAFSVARFSQARNLQETATETLTILKTQVSHPENKNRLWLQFSNRFPQETAPTGTVSGNIACKIKVEIV